jgi:hypothetical protein
MPEPDPKPEGYRSKIGPIPDDHFGNDPEFVEDPKVSDDMAEWLDELRRRRSSDHEGSLTLP